MSPDAQTLLDTVNLQITWWAQQVIACTEIGGKTMGIERCENCAYYALLEHNFKKGTGFEKSHCCVHFVCTERKGYVIEVSPDALCEVFARRADDATD